MSMGDTFENDFLKLILHGIAIAGIAENDSTTPLTQYYLSLHTADPGEAGNQGTSETAYTGYARVAVARSSSGFTITGSQAVLAADVLFGRAPRLLARRSRMPSWVQMQRAPARSSSPERSRRT